MEYSGSSDSGRISSCSGMMETNAMHALKRTTFRLNNDNTTSY